MLGEFEPDLIILDLNFRASVAPYSQIGSIDTL